MKKNLFLVFFFNFIWILSVKAQQNAEFPGITAQLDSFLQFANQLYQFNGRVSISYNGNVILDKKE